jgi:hypothetical protein
MPRTLIHWTRRRQTVIATTQRATDQTMSVMKPLIAQS